MCVDFYDDPSFAGAGVRFGPEAFATDALTRCWLYPAETRHAMEGSGQWVRRSWTGAAVNLRGVNADTYTAGPRFISENGQVAVSRIDLAVLRVGTNALAGQDPLAACVEDPNICRTNTAILRNWTSRTTSVTGSTWGAAAGIRR